MLVDREIGGSFAVDPFFFLIGLTYALTIIWALTLRFVEPPLSPAE